MPDIRPFRALRYDIARVGALSNVVAPPYDVIDAALQQQLYDLSPYNAIRMELNREQPDDSPSSNRYTRAAQFLHNWRKSGVLRADDQPALYLYHQTFKVDGHSHTRKGFFARVRLERLGKGKIFPHEQTLSGPKADRLALYHATQTQLSPIFGLYPDHTGEVLAAVEAGLVDKTPLEATDHLGVVNRLWPVTNQTTHTIVQGLMGDRPIFIADGHHRYETGLAYRDALADTHQLSGPDDPAHFAMMMLVGTCDPGLIIQPTHRLVSGLDSLTEPRLTKALAPEFEVSFQGEGITAAQKTWETIQLHGGQDLLGFGTTADNRWITARLRSDATMDRLVTNHGPEWRALAVSILHELVLKHLLGAENAQPVRYVHLLEEVTSSVSDHSCDLACLVPPATMEHVEAIASNLEKMPPKSTYFYPKLLTGLVFNPLR